MILFNSAYFALGFAALARGDDYPKPINLLTVASWGESNIDVFGVLPSGSIWHKYYRNGSEFEPSGGKFEDMQTAPASLYEPTAVSLAENQMELLWVGDDGQAYLKYWDGSKWSGNEAHGGNFSGPLSATSWGGNRLDIVGIQPNGSYVHQAWTGSFWYPGVDTWEVLDGEWSSPPAAVTPYQEMLVVLGIAKDRSLREVYFTRDEDDDWYWTTSMLVSEGFYQDRISVIRWRNETNTDHPAWDEGFWGCVIDDEALYYFSGLIMPSIEGWFESDYDVTPSMAGSYPNSVEIVGLGASKYSEKPDNPLPMVSSRWIKDNGWKGPMFGDQASNMFSHGTQVRVISVKSDQFNRFGVDKDGKLRMQIWDGSQLLPNESTYYDLGKITNLVTASAVNSEHSNQRVIAHSGL